ncbi:hypothetical protein KUC_3623 [Vreelandella boliviensis LC1]|uniref:Uncharacterized protein n=1 Tax=Vreelandella boliviensis LC1 TaxID=1072583 RepID=A0A7U9BYG7_9GAMM|nr:hypothetical protein KUC_3623 [Halomonas boliviensis LC1]
MEGEPSIPHKPTLRPLCAAFASAVIEGGLKLLFNDSDDE